MEMAAHRRVVSPVSNLSSFDDMRYREADGVLLSIHLLEVREGQPDQHAGPEDAPTSEGGPSAPSRLHSARVWFEDEERPIALSPRNVIIQFEDEVTAWS